MKKVILINYDFPEIADKNFVKHLQQFYYKICRNPYFKYLGAEDHLQIQCVQYMKFKYPDILVHHSQNENKRSNYERWFISLFGIQAGCPDLLFFKATKTYNGLAVELKVGKNKPTENQINFMKKLVAENWQTEVIYNISDFIKCVDKFLIIIK